LASHGGKPNTLIKPEKKFQPKDKEKLYRPCGLFGELGSVTQSKWKLATVFALEESSLLVFNKDSINKLVKEATLQNDYQELLGFLCSIYKEFSSLSSISQQKIIDSFKYKEFLQGQYLIKEGSIGGEAFLIKEGECIVESEQNPFSLSEKKLDVLLQSKRGFLSRTMNKLQFQILEKNQWVAEERILRKKDEPCDYSVIAKTKIKAYSITKSDAIKKLPKELLSSLMEMVKQKTKWKQDRTKSIVNTSVDIAQMDPSKAKYDEKLAKIRKKFPAATPNALINIGKLQISKTENIIPVCLTSRNEQKEGIPQKSNKTFKETSFESDSKFLLTEIPELFDSKHDKGKKALLSLKYKRPSIETPLFKHKKSKMPNATSASSIFTGFPLIPVLTKDNSKSKLKKIAKIAIETTRKRKVKPEIGPNYFQKELLSMKQFNIGSKEIQLLNKLNIKTRKETPNPFYSYRTELKNSNAKDLKDI